MPASTQRYAKKGEKYVAQTLATRLGGVAHFTLKLPHPVPSENDGGRREHQSAWRNAVFRPITSSQVRDYRGSSAVDRTAQRFSCKSWDSETVGGDRGPRVANLDGECFSKYCEYCFYVVKSGNTLPLGLFLGNKRAFKLLPAQQGRCPKLQYSMFQLMLGTLYYNLSVEFALLLTHQERGKDWNSVMNKNMNLADWNNPLIFLSVSQA